MVRPDGALAALFVLREALPPRDAAHKLPIPP
jgi:hypothetical protein